MGSNSIVKRLVIKASNKYDGDFQVVPVNANKAVEIQSDIGIFSLKVNIKNFDGSQTHKANSLYNVGDKKFLDGSDFENSEKGLDHFISNLQLQIKFKPNAPIKGSNLLFGNDFTTPIRDYVPTAILATGLKFFTWFISKTVKGDIYNDKPYLYGLALNSFTYISVGKNRYEEEGEILDGSSGDKAKDPINFAENLNKNLDNVLKIPTNSAERKKFFNDTSNCERFVFNENEEYLLQFDTSFLKMGDSKYAVSIPTFGNKTFDINVLSYANEKLDNFNWVIKQGGYEGVGYGNLGLIVNFALLNEK